MPPYWPLLRVSSPHPTALDQVLQRFACRVPIHAHRVGQTGNCPVGHSGYIACLRSVPAAMDRLAVAAKCHAAGRGRRARTTLLRARGHREERIAFVLVGGGAGDEREQVLHRAVAGLHAWWLASPTSAPS